MNNDYGKEKSRFHKGNCPGESASIIAKKNELWNEATENLDLMADSNRITRIGELIEELTDISAETVITLEELGVDPVKFWEEAPEWANHAFLYKHGHIFVTECPEYLPDNNWIGKGRCNYHSTVEIPAGINWVKCRFSRDGQ